MMQRQVFNVDTDTGTWTDSGPSFFGEVRQVRWQVTTGDTGGDIAIWLQQKPADTGNGVPIVSDNDILGSDFVRAYRQATHNSSGIAIDTGDDFSEPIVSAGDHLRVKVTPGGAAVVGTLYVWSNN